MKYLFYSTLLGLSACGYSSKNSEMVGQVKKVVNNTPLLCPDYYSVDISLGVLRGGVGSMSSEDTWATIQSPESVKVLKQAAESGQLVKATYDMRRFVFCTEERLITNVEVIK